MDDRPSEPGLDDPERAELERLRREVNELRRTAGTPGPARPAGRSRTRLRLAMAITLVVLASLLAPLAVGARYLHDQLLDTDRYVARVAQLAYEPEVREVVTEQVTVQIFTHLDVEGTLDAALEELVDRGVPEVATGLAAPLASQVETFVEDHVARFVASERFAELWEEANRAAHERLVALLTGRGTERLDIEDGRLTVDLGAVVAQVRERLLDRGFRLAERIPEVEHEFTVLEADGLTRTQNAVRWLDRASTVLPVLALALIAVAVYIAPDRRRMLIVGAAGLVLSMLAIAATLAIMRTWYVNNGAPEIMTVDAALTIARTMLVPLRTMLRMVVAAGLVVAAVAFLTGPSSSARRIRSAAGRAAAAVRDRTGRTDRPSAAEVWIGGHMHALRLGIGAGAAVILVLWEYPSAAVVLTIAAGAAVMVVLLELVGHRPSAAAPHEEEPADTET